MKRTILFKAKRLDNGEWVEGYYYKECDNTYIIEDRQNESMLNRNEAVLVDPSTVCQFTGLKDKNGVDVWEGDLLYDYMESSLAEVVFENGAYMIGDEPLSNFVLWDKNVISLPVKGSKFDRKECE